MLGQSWSDQGTFLKSNLSYYQMLLATESYINVDEFVSPAVLAQHIYRLIQFKSIDVTISWMNDVIIKAVAFLSFINRITDHNGKVLRNYKINIQVYYQSISTAKHKLNSLSPNSVYTTTYWRRAIYVYQCNKIKSIIFI